jgi:hypothetical protein
VPAVARGRGSSPRVGIGSPRARNLVGGGGDDLYITQRGRSASLLVIWGIPKSGFSDSQ